MLGKAVPQPDWQKGTWRFLKLTMAEIQLDLADIETNPNFCPAFSEESSGYCRKIMPASDWPCEDTQKNNFISFFFFDGLGGF